MSVVHSAVHFLIHAKGAITPWPTPKPQWCSWVSANLQSQHFPLVLLLLQSFYPRPLNTGTRIQKGKFCQISSISQLSENFKIQRKLDENLSWCKGGQLVLFTIQTTKQYFHFGQTTWMYILSVGRKDLPFQTVVRSKWEVARTENYKNKLYFTNCKIVASILSVIAIIFSNNYLIYA